MTAPGRLSSAIVVGGGLAGIAAAVKLADAGLAVTLVETRPRLGGRATSFDDPATGQTLDNCQHVLLGCCTNLMHLYRRLGVSDLIHWHRRVFFADAKGNLDTLEADDLPAPLHMTRGLLAFKSLAWSDKLAIARGMAAMMRLSRKRQEELDRVSFEDWLVAHGQPRRTIDRFWALIAVSAINELPRRMAAWHAIQVFREGFLAHQDAYVMGLSSVPLVRLYDAAETVLSASAGKAVLGCGAQKFEFDGRRVTHLRTTRDEVITGDHFVGAVPFDRLAKLCDPSLRGADERLQRLDEFEVSPIIGIHLQLERDDGQPVMDLPHLVLMDSPLQWVFNKGRGHLHGVISAAHEFVEQPAEQLTALALREIRRHIPSARRATLTHSRVVKEKRATFSAAPGSAALRPGPRGAVRNLYLAGDWCASGWPATMEGAVRSGYLAAHALLEDCGWAQGPALEPDLPPAGLSSWMLAW